MPNVPLRVVCKHACRDFPGGPVPNSPLPRASDAAEWRTELSHGQRGPSGPQLGPEVARYIDFNSFQKKKMPGRS